MWQKKIEHKCSHECQNIDWPSGKILAILGKKVENQNCVRFAHGLLPSRKYLRSRTLEAGKFLITSGCTELQRSLVIDGVKCGSVLTLNDLTYLVRQWWRSLCASKARDDGDLKTAHLRQKTNWMSLIRNNVSFGWRLTSQSFAELGSWNSRSRITLVYLWSAQYENLVL